MIPGVSRPIRSVVLAFLAVVVVFCASLLIAETRATPIARHADGLTDDVVPALRRLTAIRGYLRQLEVRSDRMADVGEALALHGEESTAELLARRDEELSGYYALPALPGETTTRQELRRHLADFDRGLLLVEEQLFAGEKRAARETSEGVLRRSAARADERLEALLELKASAAVSLIEIIADAREASRRALFVFGGAALLIAGAAVLYSRRVLADQERLVLAHENLLRASARELEDFASRVAHDILSPLAATSFALQLAKDCGDDEGRRAHILKRGESSLRQVKETVTGLYEFARAGASVTSRQRADVLATAEQVVSTLATQAGLDASDVTVDVPVDLAVACAPGILVSCLSNLLENAIKYATDSPVRAIAVRARADGRDVVCEVSDSGPGLSPELMDRAFLPHARGAEHGQSGLGLGLATVKRLVEGHGGTVGVTSRAGFGCTFWLRLPKAPDA